MTHLKSAAGMKAQRGYTLVSVLVIVLIVGIMATGSMDLGHLSEKVAGDAIQRDRAFQAADGGVTLAQLDVPLMLRRRLVADSRASEGVFSYNAQGQKWWRSDTYTGEHYADGNAVLGVVMPPRFIYEELGRYITDGGTGVTSLDIGSAAYGRRSRGGRDVVLYRIESHGRGSFNEVQSVVEAVVAYSY